MKCPKCGIENDDNWPINVKGKIKDGGCQGCWEAECNDWWWFQIAYLHKIGLLEELEG